MPSSMAFSLRQTRKTWGAPLRQSPAEGARTLHGPSPPRLSGGPVSAPLAETVPRACSRLRTLRAVLVSSSVTIEGAHPQPTCQVFYQARGERKRDGFPAMAISLRTPPALFFSLLAPTLPETARLACGLMGWHKRWDSFSVT